MPNNPHASPVGTGGPVIGGTDPTGHPLPPIVEPPPPPPPIDPDTLHQIEMLNEAVLNKFAADLPAAKPFETNTLRWDVTMPTTVIPGVHPFLRLSVGPNGSVDDLDPVGSRPAKERYATSYALSIIAPKASRQLGTLTIDVDLSDAMSFQLNPILFTDPVRDQLKAGFPDGGDLTLRSDPVIGVHSEAVTVDLALTVHVPNFFDADAAVSVSWTLSGRGIAWNDPIDADARIECAISTARTTVDPGALGTIFSAGIADVAAATAEKVSDGYLGQLVGPLIAQGIQQQLVGIRDAQRPGQPPDDGPPARPPEFILHHLDVTPDWVTFWYCKNPSWTAPSTQPGGGTLPVHPTHLG